MNALRLSRADVEVLAMDGAQLGALIPLRDRLRELLAVAPAQSFVLAPARCSCPRGFGAVRDPSCVVCR